MFTIGQKVTCVGADNQPRLSEGKKYTVYEVTTNGVRVESTEGRIPYDYSNSRFEAVSVSAENDGLDFHLEDDFNLTDKTGFLVVEGVTYKVSLGWNYDPGQLCIEGIKKLS